MQPSQALIIVCHWSVPRNTGHKTQDTGTSSSSAHHQALDHQAEVKTMKATQRKLHKNRERESERDIDVDVKRGIQRDFWGGWKTFKSQPNDGKHCGMGINEGLALLNDV